MSDGRAAPTPQRRRDGLRSRREARAAALAPASSVTLSLVLVATLATGCGVAGGARPSAPSPGPGAESGDGGGAPPDGRGTDGGESDDGDIGTAVSATPASPLSGMTVAIDPGHNGGNAEASGEIARQVPAGPETKECDTVGAESDDGYPEHEFTWDFSKRLGDRLEKEGVKVVYTRDDDKGVGPCINERAKIGNDADADAAISIHADGADSDGSGFHVIAPGLIKGHTDDIVKPSGRLAEDVRDQFHELSGQPYSDYLGEDGIDVRTDLGGLNTSTVPKVFLEVGNMSNAGDAKNLKDPEWRTRAANAAAAGLIRFLVGD